MENQNNKRLSAACRYSYTELALNYYMYYEMVTEDADIPEEICAISDMFHAILREFLQGKPAMSELELLRLKITSHMERVAAYADCFQIYEYVLNRMEHKFLSLPDEDSDVEELAKTLCEFVAASPDSVTSNRRIQEIKGQLPIRFTKAKFFSMLTEGLSVYKGSDKKSIEQILYILRTGTMCLLPKGMEEHHEELEAIRKQMQETKYKDLTKATFEELKQNLLLASELISRDISYYLVLQDMVNELLVIFLTQEVAITRADEKQTVQALIKGILTKFEAKDSSALEADTNSLLEDLEGVQEHLYQIYEQCESVTALDQKIDRLLSGNFFVSLEEEENGTECSDATWIEETIASFVKELEALFATLEKPVIRAVMAEVISELPPLFRSLEEFKEYIIGSLSSCSDQHEKSTCIELLKSLMVDEHDMA